MPPASLSVQLSNLAAKLFQDHIGAVITGIIILVAIIIAVTSWVTKVNVSRSTLADFIKEIRDDIKKIFDRLPAPTIASQSPIRLTDLGNEIATEIKVHEWISDYAARLSGSIESKSAYDIQEFCFQQAQEKLLADVESGVVTRITGEDIKMSAYNHGLELKGVFDVVGVVLRDEMLKRLNIDMSSD